MASPSFSPRWRTWCARGDLERAGTLLEESLALFRGLGHAWGIARTLTSLGGVACEAGEDARASTLYEEGLELERMSGNMLGAAACLEGLARVAAARGEPVRAARLCGAAAALREEIDAPLPPVARADHERNVAAARAGLGEEAFESAWAQGRAMDPERAIEYASQGKRRSGSLTRSSLCPSSSNHRLTNRPKRSPAASKRWRSSSPEG